MEFYEKFEIACRSRNTTPSAVAKKIGLSNSTAAYWKKSGSVPKHETIEQLANELKIDPIDLMNDDELRNVLKHTIMTAVELSHNRESLTQAAKISGNPELYEKNISDMEKYIAEQSHVISELNQKIEENQRVSEEISMKRSKEQLLCYFDKLNLQGRQRAVDQIQDLAKIPDYQKDKIPPEGE